MLSFPQSSSSSEIRNNVSLTHDVFRLHAISLSFAHKLSRSCVAMLDVAFRTSALRLSRLWHGHIPRKALPRKAKVRPGRALVHDTLW